jgi:hypothetical protein
LKHIAFNAQSGGIVFWARLSEQIQAANLSEYDQW